MGRAVILTAYLPEGVRAVYAPRPGDFLICADGGYRLALEAELCPDAFIGDFDSLPEQEIPCPESIRVPVEKDDTDTMLCVRHSIGKGFTELLILGGLGGRLDHTIANLQTLSFAQAHGVNARILDSRNEAFLLPPGRYTLREKAGWKLSLFAWGGDCGGVSLRGTYYPLENGTLTPTFPLGVSNAFAAPEAEISLASGMLLCILSQC